MLLCLFFVFGKRQWGVVVRNLLGNCLVCSHVDGLAALLKILVLSTVPLYLNYIFEVLM